MTNRTVLKIGQSTLSIYIIHFIVLYGSFTGLGLYRFLDHSLSPVIAVIGALLFMITCTYASLVYEKRKERIKLNLATRLRRVWVWAEPWYNFTVKLLRTTFFKIRFMLMKLFRLAKN